MLYAFGSNGSGQLGVGHMEDSPIPKRSTQINYGENTRIRQIAAGGNHTLIVSSDGTVASIGSSESAQCGRQSTPFPPDHSPNDIELDMPWQVSATWSSSHYLLGGNAIMATGDGVSGELGLGTGVTRALYPQRIANFPPANTRIVQISSCMAHTVAILDNGTAYGWGKGGQGQLGDPAENVWLPRKIEGIPFPAIKAACGKDFTCIIGDRAEGKLIILGLEKRDRFGVLASQPAAVPGWNDIGASWGSVFILKQSGELIGFGRNDHGQLPPLGLPPIEKFAAGSEHCLALTKAGKVLAWGWGEHGNCGEYTDSDGDVKGRWNEIGIPRREKVIGVYAGCATSFIVTAEDSEQKSQQE
ncbi:hypothetical protein LTR08_008615 [Meristemomyces frigidus]|nr:hypothetical protein LTR08_008615 [Meristemomyces frigidus]